jgi:predicted AAA+ superfamily ATPase
MDALGDEANVSHNTIREWISVLEASYIVHRLPPQHRNFNKRLVKTPKLYFYDTGLACWLLGIETSFQLGTHPQRGALFETWVVTDYLKKRLNLAKPSNLSFWRDRSGHEVDLLIEAGGRLQALEIKSGATPTGDAMRGLEKWKLIAGDAAEHPCLVYGGDETQERTDISVLGWREV